MKTEQMTSNDEQTEITPETEREHIPHTALYFILVLIIGYGIYFLLIGHELIALRGGM